MKKNDIRNLLISSPNDTFISYLKEQLDYIQHIRVGQMKFKIDYSDKFNIALPKDGMFTLITATPIISIIFRYRYEMMNEQQLINGYDEVYWRSNHPVELFLTQLEDNLMKKYNQYYGLEDEQTERDPIFYKSRFLRQISTKLHFVREGDTYTHKVPVIGTTWEFELSSDVLAQFALDAGLGELNSLGFGFMNVKKRGQGVEKRNCNN